MEPARRLLPEDETVPVFEGRAPIEADHDSTGIEKVLRFAMPPRPEAGPAQRTNTPMTARDFAAAMDIVREAADAVRAAETRAREADVRTHSVAQRVAEELKSAEARVLAADARTRAAEARAQEAETRADEVEGWVRQIFATISDELPVRRPA